MSRFLFNESRMRSTLSPYERLSATIDDLRSRPSEAHPESDWRTADTCFSAMLSRASATSADPHPRLRALELPLSTQWGDSRDGADLLRTRDSVRFLSCLAEALTLHSLLEGGFAFVSPPPSANVDSKSKTPPDITGTLAGIGVLAVEVYQPKDEIAYRGYMEDLQNLLDLADVGWSYTAGISWTISDRSRSGRTAPKREIRERHTEACLREIMAQVEEGRDTAATVLEEGSIGLRAEIDVRDIQPWTDPDQIPDRNRCEGWSFGPWNAEAYADSIARRVAVKSRKRQASRGDADLRVLVVDCSAVRPYWDLALQPDVRMTASLCAALEARAGSIDRQLDGFLLLAPYVPLGQARRLVLASADLPRELFDVLAGCSWEPEQVGRTLVCCRS